MFSAGVGFRLNLTDARRYLIRGEGVLENVQRNDYGAMGDFDNLLGARVSVHARYYYQKGFYQFLEASAATLEKGEGEKDPKPEAGAGRLAAAFPLVRMGANAAAARDPNKKALLDQKEQIENQIDKLKYEKAVMNAADYKKQLTGLLLQLAKVQEALEK